MKNQAEQKVVVEGSGSIGSVTQIMRFGIPLILILAVILIAVTQMTGYDLRPAIDTILYGATPTPSYPICTVTISEHSCLWIYKNADYANSERYGCLQDGAKIQVTGIADPYYEISAYGIESVFVYEDRGVLVTEIMNDTPAEEAGLQNGDIILRINDVPTSEISDLGGYAEQFVGQQINLLVKRDGQEQTLFVTPQDSYKYGWGSDVYAKPPIGYSYYRINPNGLEANRGYILGYSVDTPTFGGNVTMTSYVSCPAQLVQPLMPDDK